jgi:hypothetical protein
MCLTLTLPSARGWAEEAPEESPHHMTKSDGSLDGDRCGECHNEDLSLPGSKLEVCTTCHERTTHAGSEEHLRASPAAVKQALAQRKPDAPDLPLEDDGRMYCGTCHFFHDPQVDSEVWLVSGWLPLDSGLAAAVREGVIERWVALAERSNEKGSVGDFATTGARALRLPVDDGQLCRQCHGYRR